MVNAPGATWSAAGSRLVGDFLSDSNAPLEIYLTIVTSFDSPDPLAEAKQRLRSAAQLQYEGLLNSHCQWWKRFWERSFVSFGDKDIEKWWYVSNYLCGSILRPGKQTPGLQGVWVKENYAAVGWRLPRQRQHAVALLEFVPLEPSGTCRALLSVLHGHSAPCRKDAKGYFGMREKSTASRRRYPRLRNYRHLDYPCDFDLAFRMAR